MAEYELCEIDVRQRLPARRGDDHDGRDETDAIATACCHHDYSACGRRKAHQTSPATPAPPAYTSTRSAGVAVAPTSHVSDTTPPDA